MCRTGGMVVTGGTEVPRENPVQMLLCASKISHRLVGDPTQASGGARPATDRPPKPWHGPRTVVFKNSVPTSV